MDLQLILQKINEKTGLSNEDITKKVLEKQQELSGLISKEGAAYILAKEMGIEITTPKKKAEIKDIASNFKNLNFQASVVRISDVREFVRNNKRGRVANIFLADNSGTIRLSLWDNQ